MDRQYFEIFCEELAKKFAKRRVPPHQIPQKLSNNKHLLKLLGIKRTGAGVKVSRKGALHRFGESWCDSIMDTKLIETGAYEKLDDETWRFASGTQEERSEDA